MHRIYFVTSTGTEIGKTLVTAALCCQLREAGQTVHALKPVISGFDGSETTDTAYILQSLGQSVTRENVECVSPWRFAAPLSPHMAASRENRAIDFDALVRFCQPQDGVLLVEGAGGVMAPLTGNHTTLDWIEALDCPAILVAGSYLGTISHTLSALECLKNRNIPVAALVISESEKSPVLPEETLASLKNFMPTSIKTAIIPRLPKAAQMWKHVPDLTHLIA